MGELYGEVNKLTMEWKDGLMAMTVRQCVQVKYKKHQADFTRDSIRFSMLKLHFVFIYPQSLGAFWFQKHGSHMLLLKSY